MIPSAPLDRGVGLVLGAAALGEDAARRERDRALRVARSRAIRGDETAAHIWHQIACGFAQPDPRQQRRFESAILAGRRGFIHPGQLRLSADLD
jgi:hypothetical protein